MIAGGHAWLQGGVRGCWGACMVAVGGMRGCWGACMVAGWACMLAGGHAWLPGDVHGCQMACVVAQGCVVARVVCGWQGACMVARGCVVAGGHVWLPGGHAWLLGGVHRIRRDTVNERADTHPTGMHSSFNKVFS